MKINNVLIIRPDAMGDFISIIPVIKTLKDNFPRSKVTVLGSNANKDVASYVVEMDDFINANDYLRNYSLLIKEVKKRKFDVALVYNHDTKWALLPLFAGIKTRIGDKYRLFIRFLFNKGVYINNADHSKHVVEYNLQYLKCLGVKKFTENILIDYKKTKGISKKINLMSEYIVFHVGHLGGSGGREWSVNAYVDVINKLHLYREIQVVLTGQKHFIEFANKISQKVQNKKLILNLIDQTTISELIEILRDAKVYVGTDTGVTHLAAACNVPCVFIMGVKAIKPIRWYPFGVPLKIIRTNVLCPYVCHFSKCKFNECIENISADKIAESVNELLTSKNNQCDLRQNKLDAFYKSMSVLLIYKNKETKLITDLLGKYLNEIGVRVIDINYFNIFHFAKIWRLCIKYDITIIHAVSKSSLVLAWIFKQILPVVSFVKPLVINGSVKVQAKEELIAMYLNALNELSIKANRKYWK